MTLRLSIHDQSEANPTKTRRRLTSQPKQEAVEICLAEGLSCTAVAQRLELPNGSLAHWLIQPNTCSIPRRALIALAEPPWRAFLTIDPLRRGREPAGLNQGAASSWYQRDPPCPKPPASERAACSS